MTDEPLRRPVASVVVPAHDEERVIARCLDTLLAGASPGEFEVVVVTNGCTDRTAEIAGAYAPMVTVLDIAQPSKVAALNTGDRALTAFPRAYLDADIEMSASSLRAVVAVLDEGVALCSAPPMRLELDGVPWYIRSFYSAFSDLPYLADDLVGNGVYVLSEQGRARFDVFPELTADDLFIRNLFAASERRSAPTGEFVVRPPRTLAGLLAIRQRGYRGSDEYAASGHRSAAEPTLDRGRILTGLRRKPVAMSIFLAINVWAKVLLRFGRRSQRWERDDSSRS